MDQRLIVKQYVDVAWRRRWWIIVPVVAGSIVSAVLAVTLPKVYQASTTILVTRQSIPEEIVRTTVTTRIEERIRSLKIQVKSRLYLEKVAKQFGFVPENASDREIERACARLSQDVDLDWDRQGLSWFRIMAEDADPKRAADVANRLAELFIEQNSAEREAQAKGTVETVEGWREQMEKQLRERDTKIAGFRAQYTYELPEQEAATLQLLNAAQTRIQQLTSDLQMRAERLSTARADQKARRATAQALGIPATDDNPDAQALAQMQRELQDLLTSYTEENPLVKRKRDQIAQFRALHPELAAPKPGQQDESSDADSPDIARLQGEIRSLEADRAREQRTVDELRKRLANMPLRAQELANLTRDYDSLKREFDNTVAQKQQATRAQELEEAKKGVQFRIQDYARPPVAPAKPQVPLLLALGLIGGLALGAGMAALLEFLDHTVRNEEEFALRYPDLPILGSIPNLDSDRRKPRAGHGRRTKVGAAAGVVAVAAVLARLVLGVFGGVWA